MLRHPPGLWGSLAALRAHYPDGLAPRHVVWMWRRTLDLLAYVHGAGLAHGAIEPGHLLVQPADHGIVLTGWARACQASDAACARDLRQAAWSMRSLLGADQHASARAPALPSTLPAPLAALLQRASEHDDGDASDSAARLLEASRASFGAARFIVLATAPPHFTAALLR
ncbi:hypothetical protein [Massilia sp. PWRC2]|uniref:hypothetical protein n=1 Tax=Massilia sp. PWRC2 TaxID=2804626 RepID=UPI003CE7A308